MELRRRRPNAEVTAVVLVFALYFHGAGILIPYFPLWLHDRGLSPAEISFVLGAPLLLRTAASPLFGHIGDAFGQRRVIRVMTVLALAAGCCLPLATAFWPIMLLALVTYVAWQSMPLQMDAIAIDLVRRELVSTYGSIRAFGSSAFVAANVAGGVVIGAFGSAGFLLYLLFAAVLLLVATTWLPAAADRSEASAGALPANVWRQPGLVAVMLAAALVQGAHSAFMSLGALHMRDIGYSDALTGVVLATATGAEVLMFAVGARFTRRIPPITLIAVGAGVAVLRWIAVALVEAPALLLALQCTHALTFGGTALGVIGFIVETVDRRQVASAQGIYVALFGASNALLTLAIGSVYERLGGLSFMISAAPPVLAIVILAVRAAVFRRPHA